MAAMVPCLSSCVALNSKFKTLSLNGSAPSSSSSSSSSSARPRLTASLGSSLSFSASLSQSFAFSSGIPWVQRPMRHTIVCEAAQKRRADSAAKRARQAEKRRIYNKSRKSEIRTRMKKVLEALDGLRKKEAAQQEEILPVEKLIAEAFSAIDKAVKVGTLHRNTAARRKSRLARRKKAVEIYHGWYVPEAATLAA